MAATVFSWASITPATNCWPPLSAFASGRGVSVAGVLAVAVRSLRVVRAAAGLRDFDALRVLRERVVDLAFAREAGLRLGVAFFAESAGLVSVCVVAVSVAMVGSSVSVYWC
jgi:hypothetical protein